jgi:hypothetical protein
LVPFWYMQRLLTVPVSARPARTMWEESAKPPLRVWIRHCEGQVTHEEGGTGPGSGVVSADAPAGTIAPKVSVAAAIAMWFLRRISLSDLRTPRKA